MSCPIWVSSFTLGYHATLDNWIIRFMMGVGSMQHLLYFQRSDNWVGCDSHTESTMSTWLNPNNTLNTQEPGSLLRLTVLCVYFHISSPEYLMLSMILLGEDKWKPHIWNFLGFFPMHIFPWMILPVFFHLINYKWKYNSFQWVLQVLLVNYQTKGDFENPQTLQLVVEFRLLLCTVFLNFTGALIKFPLF